MDRSHTETVNIGLKERKVRRALGIGFLLIYLIVTVFFAGSEVSPIWGLILFPITYQGVRFFLDYRTGTCPLKAELGQQKLDGTLTILGEKIQDENQVREIRRKSRRALVQSLGGGIVLTAFTISLMML